jgi:hypothetical protein
MTRCLQHDPRFASGAQLPAGVARYWHMPCGILYACTLPTGSTSTIGCACVTSPSVVTVHLLCVASPLAGAARHCCMPCGRPNVLCQRAAHARPAVYTMTDGIALCLLNPCRCCQALQHAMWMPPCTLPTCSASTTAAHVVINHRLSLLLGFPAGVARHCCMPRGRPNVLCERAVHPRPGAQVRSTSCAVQ